ncbi:HdeD family acid-resistance protein [Actinomadura bangladeshensis]|uniref:HdeD family acid-resistance protein n=1 Tax=Actinomadura bangladeshensis TaxID=453573 RepID=A0A4R4P1C4_9ACTN|nr:HdeD family acid-resistance protein [Actinomadura bangladeshensis]TDC16058.1 HdeD family acid-resistance protein [Actinomadura bangladeshensis]
MLDLMTRHWWVLALRGAFAILFGIVALVWPGITVFALVLLFGAYALADGIVAVTQAVRGTTGGPRGLLALSGVAGIALGIAALAWPGITAFILLMLIAAWAVATGLLEIVVAVALHRELRGEWLYVLTGAISLIFGILLFAWPVSGAIAVVWLIGLLALLFGAAMLGVAFRLRRLGRTAERPHGAPTAHRP